MVQKIKSCSDGTDLNTNHPSNQQQIVARGGGSSEELPDTCF